MVTTLSLVCLSNALPSFLLIELSCLKIDCHWFPVCLLLLQDYLNSLGKARTAQVQKDARIGEAQYKRDAVIRVKCLLLFVFFHSCHSAYLLT